MEPKRREPSSHSAPFSALSFTRSFFPSSASTTSESFQAPWDTPMAYFSAVIRLS